MSKPTDETICDIEDWIDREKIVEYASLVSQLRMLKLNHLNWHECITTNVIHFLNYIESRKMCSVTKLLKNDDCKSVTAIVAPKQDHEEYFMYKDPEHKIIGGLTTIGELENVIHIPEGVTTIGNYAFTDSEELEYITFPDSLEYIGCQAFKNCNKLVKIRIPENVTTIYDDAFAGCESLQYVDLPKTLDLFGSNAFYQCNKLKFLVFPVSKSYDFSSVQSCKNLNLLLPAEINMYNPTFKQRLEEKGGLNSVNIMDH